MHRSGPEHDRLQTRTNRGALLIQIGRYAESADLLREQYRLAKLGAVTQALYFSASNLGCALLALGNMLGRTLLLQRCANVFSVSSAAHNRSLCALYPRLVIRASESDSKIQMRFRSV